MPAYRKFGPDSIQKETFAVRESAFFQTLAENISGGTVSGYQYRGTAGNDIIDATDFGTAFPAVTEVRGLAGADIIYAPTDTGIDIIGADTGNPGADHDIISYERFTSGVVLTISATYAAGQKTGYFFAEQIRGSNFGDSITLRASSPILIVDGAGGDDVIAAATNVGQTIYGGVGNDTISAGGQGRYTVDGGTGANTLIVALHATQTAGATITLNNTGAGSVAYNDGLGSSLSFTNFQTVTGTGLDDTITGSAGNDRINGGKGNDVIIGSAGSDMIDGGRDSNTLSYADFGQALRFDVNQGATTNGTVTDLASSGLNVHTQYSGISVIIGTLSNDYFYVSPDVIPHIDGHGGDDVLTFTSGTFDPVTGGTGGNYVILGTLTLSGLYENIKTIYASQYSDTIIGDTRANNIYGASGSDWLDGRGGDDRLDGRDGHDTLSFQAGAWGITLDLTAYFPEVLDPNHQYYPANFLGHGQDGFYTYQDAGGTYVGTFFNMETYVGSSFDDRLFGGWSNDTIDGGAGNDYFRAGIGDDVLTGGDGNDLIFAGPGTDNVYGGNNNDYLNGGASGDDVLYGGNGDDVIEEYSGLNTLAGGAGRDTFVFDALIRAAAQPTTFGVNEVHDTLNIITDFHVGNTTTDVNADILDLSPLLTNLFYQATSLTAIDPAVLSSASATNITDFDYAADPNGTTLGQYVRVVQVNGTGDYHLQVNVDSATGFAAFSGLTTGGWTDVAVLQGTAGTTLTLDQLLANHEILFAPHQQQSQAHGGTLAEYPYVVGDPALAPYFHPTLPVPNHG
ncbi:MAG TPA: calcium-binding protein [Dongiaceae bacterium]|jgi:Ca2+-binding RTX toxin-like protein|nr:calcium-binding protein [Dongiaceae bacterium]